MQDGAAGNAKDPTLAANAAAKPSHERLDQEQHPSRPSAKHADGQGVPPQDSTVADKLHQPKNQQAFRHEQRKWGGARRDAAANKAPLPEKHPVPRQAGRHSGAGRASASAGAQAAAGRGEQARRPLRGSLQRRKELRSGQLTRPREHNDSKPQAQEGQSQPGRRSGCGQRKRGPPMPIEGAKRMPK